MIIVVCNEIDKIDIIVGNIVVSEIKVFGICWRLFVSVNKLIDIYLEIYDL